VDLVGAVEQPHRAVPGVHGRQRRDVGDAGAAVDLDGPVDDLGGRAGHRDLGHGDQVPGGLVAGYVDDVAGAVAQQPGLLDLEPDSAICSRTTPWPASGPPKATRSLARCTSSARARSAAPRARMQW